MRMQEFGELEEKELGFDTPLKDLYKIKDFYKDYQNEFEGRSTRAMIRFLGEEQSYQVKYRNQYDKEQEELMEIRLYLADLIKNVHKQIKIKKMGY